jgi:hypothetical protein
MTKKDRQVAAINAAMERTLRRVASLSIALMRADAAYEKGAEAMKAALAQGLSDDDLVIQLVDCTHRVQNNELSRAAGLLALHLASVYAVAEKWTKWKFADVTVDGLLASPHLRVLKKYRQGVFHVDEFDARSLVELATRKEVIDWSKGLADSFRTVLRSWADDAKTRMTEHLLRTHT